MMSAIAIDAAFATFFTAAPSPATPEAHERGTQIVVEADDATPLTIRCVVTEDTLSSGEHQIVGNSQWKQKPEVNTDFVVDVSLDGVTTAKSWNPSTSALSLGRSKQTLSIQAPAGGSVDSSCQSIELAPVEAAKPGPGKSASEPSNQYDEDVGDIVAAARHWMGAHGYLEPKIEQLGGVRRRITIYHTPDGRVAHVIPSDIEETDTIVLAVVVPDNGRAPIVPKSCPKLEEGRVRSSFSEASEAVGGLKRDGDGRVLGLDAIIWTVEYAGEYRCSEELEYEVHTDFYVTQDDDGDDQPPAKKTFHRLSAQTLTLDPVYFITVGAALAFDFGRPTNVSLHERPSSAMAGQTEKFVGSRRDFGGLSPLITVGAHPCGANPKRWRACDMFSPTVVVDPTRLTKGFGLGMSFSFTPWFGVLVAANAYKSTVLQKNSGISIGDVWDTPGDVPTREVFNAQSFGAFVGVSLTTDLLNAIIGKSKKK